MRYEFVKNTMRKLMRSNFLAPSHSVLCVAASASEATLFKELGFATVTISNMDERMMGDSFAPFDWSFQDAMKLSFPDNSFDYGFVSDGLHHCDSPHRALVELFRVARNGIIVFESRDSLTMKLAELLSLTPRYEIEAVAGNEFKYGGVNNTDVPNFIYRWTESEFEKTIRSYCPYGDMNFNYFYGLNLPYAMAKVKKIH